VGPNQPPIQCVQGVPSWGVKQPGCEVDGWPLSSAEVKNDCSYTSTHPCAFMMWRGTILPFFCLSDNLCSGQHFLLCYTKENSLNMQFVISCA
jgi:hypothetical protein